MSGFKVARNLASLHVIKIAKWLNLVMPVVVLFYRANDMTMQDIFLLKAIYSFTLMLFEIPTGYFADRAGRKTSILIGSILGTAGYSIYSMSSGFLEFIVAEVALGISMSLVSGADSAMLFDTLRAAGQDSKYTRLEGRISSVGNFSEAIAGIIGGSLAIISLRTPFYLQTVIAAMAIPAAILLREPPLVLQPVKTGLSQIMKVIKHTLLIDQKLRWAIILSAVIGASTLTMAWFVQPFLIAARLKIEWFGIAWAFLNTAVGIAAYLSWRVEERKGSARLVTAIVLVLTSSYIFISILPLVAGFFALVAFHVFRGLATPTLRNYINLLTATEVRATVLSVRNFIIRLLFAILGPLFGWITDAYSLDTAFLAAGVSFGLMSAISLFFFLKHESYKR